MVTSFKKVLTLLLISTLPLLLFAQEITEEPVSEDITPPVLPEIVSVALPAPAEEALLEIEATTPAVTEKIQLIAIPDSDRKEVEKFRQQYLSPRWQNLLRNDLEAAMEYRLYVRKALQEREMPAYLEYLPVVESNYKTTAKSKSGALGMWQFMENSVRPF